MTKCIKRIRDLFEYALYKFALYLLTHLLFKVIDLDIPKKLVTSACYDKQHVCAYLQPFSRQTSQWRQNSVLLRWVPLFRPLVRGNPLNTAA